MTRRTSSLVWRFFDRVSENGKVHSVVCKLCDTQYKYFGNTTNLKSHLVRKHPIQWDLLTTGSLDETARQRLDNAEGDDSTCQSPPITRQTRVYKTDKNVDQSDLEGDHNNDEESVAVKYLVRNMHGKGSDEEWLDDDPFQTTQFETYEPKRKKARVVKVKHEVDTPRRQSYYQSSPILVKQNQIPQSEPRDEYSVFGEYIANKLRKFKASRTRGNIQQLITTILWQAEYGIYDDANAVKRVLMISTEMSASENVQDVNPEPEQEPESVVTVETETFE